MTERRDDEGGVTMKASDVDAKEFGKSGAADPNICALTGKPIVNPPATLEGILDRVERASKLSFNAQVRQALNLIDPKLN